VSDAPAPEDSPRPRPSSVLALDPGREKCGLAQVRPDGEVWRRAVLPVADAPAAVLSWAESDTVVVLGRGTGHKDLARLLREAGVQFLLADERDTTLEARRLYWQANPPRGWRRFLPRGLLVPREALDDWAAVAIARRFLQRGA